MSRCALFDEMTSPAALAAAFARVRRNRGGPGGDGETVAAFASARAANLRRLRRELVAFAYRPGPLRRYRLAKPSGGARWITVPSVRDRVAQTAAAQALARAVDPVLSQASFAYRSGLSVERAAGAITTYRLQGYVHVVEGDIEGFFDRIPHGVAIAALRPHAGYPLLRLVGLWLAGFSRFRRGLAQGSPLSPVLANLVLDPVDRAVESRRVRLVRYSDDFLLMARSRADAEAAAARMEAGLAGIGLSLKAGKTRLARFDEGVRFLGLEFSGDRVARAG